MLPALTTATRRTPKIKTSTQPADSKNTQRNHSVLCVPATPQDDLLTASRHRDEGGELPQFPRGAHNLFEH